MDPDLAASFAERWHGPFGFRLLLQPVMAAAFAFRDGRRDARIHAPPFFLAILLQRQTRRSAIASAWASVSKVLALALILDCAFQYLAFDRIDVVLAGTVAVFLGVVPYVLMRGPVTWIFRGIDRRSKCDG